MKPTTSKLLPAAVLLLGVTMSATAEAQQTTPAEQPQQPPQGQSQPQQPQPFQPQMQGQGQGQMQGQGQGQGQMQPQPQPQFQQQPFQPGPQPAPPAYGAGGRVEFGAGGASGGASGPDPSGFHISAGIGLSGHFAAGIGSQLKIGYRLNEKMRIFLHSIHHWYAQVDVFSFNDANVTQATWRVAMMNGVGLDYYILPRIAVRGGLGLGSEIPLDDSDPRGANTAMGYSFLMGLSFDATEGDHRITIDPYVHMLQHNRANLQPDTGNQWVSRPIIGVTANYAFH